MTAAFMTENTDSKLTVVDSARALATAFSLLIRNSRTQSQQLFGLGQRVMQVWEEAPEMVLRFTPDYIEIDGKVVLDDEKSLGDWLLPAFMCGMRSIRLNESARVDDFVSLATEMGGLEIDAGVMTRFRDWVWSEGAEGLDIDMQLSFVEVLDVMGSGVGELELINQGHARATTLLARAMSKTALPHEELVIASRRPEFHASMELFSQGAKYRGFEMTPGERELLQQGCNDVESWGLAEVDAVLSNQNLRGAISAPRLARRLLDRLMMGASVKLLQQVERLYLSPEDPFCKLITRQLDSASMGKRLGATINLHDEAMRRAAISLVEHISAAQAAGFLQDVLARAQRDGAVYADALAFFGRLGIDRARATLNIAELPFEAALALGRICQDLGVPPMVLARVLETLNDRATALLFVELSDVYRIDAEPRLKQLLSSAPRATVEPLIEELVGSNQPGLVQMLALLMRNESKLKWSRRSIRKVCEAVVDQGVEETFLVPLVRDRSATESCREIALDVLLKYDRQDMVKLATRWRLGELFDPPQFRERVKTGRRRVKTLERESEISSVANDEED